MIETDLSVELYAFETKERERREGGQKEGGRESEGNESGESKQDGG